MDGYAQRTLYLATIVPKSINILYRSFGKYQLSGGTTSVRFTHLCSEILNMNRSIRFVGLANSLGTLLSARYRQGLTPFMTEEETQHYAIQAVLRAAIREDFISKLGKLKHSIGTYDRLIRATVPVIIEDNHEAKFFLLISFDVGTDAKTIIENQLLPYIDKNMKMFK